MRLAPGARQRGKSFHVSMRNLDKYEGRYASRTRVMRSSVMRDLMSLTARPEVISLAGGLPATDTFPRDVFERINADISAEHRALALQYGPTEGFDFLKDDIAAVMAAEGTPADPQWIMVTTGGQQAIDLVTKTFIDPGDVVLAEGPSYAGALTTFSTYQTDVRHVPMDEDGLIVDVLEELMDRVENEGTRSKFLYVVPNFSNPGGTCLSLARRHQLIELSARRDLLIVEDNPYGMVRFEGEPLPTLRSLDRSGNVIYLGSFSKILAPGIRLGWIAAPPAVYQKIVFGKQATDLCSSPFTQLFVHEFVSSGAWLDYLELVRALYRSRAQVLVEALAEEFPEGSTWSVPTGGMFVWATLPGGLHTGDMMAKALEENVAYVRGDAFFMDGQGTSSMRLNFSGNTEDRIREGVRRLGRVIKDQQELYRALGL